VGSGYIVCRVPPFRFFKGGIPRSSPAWNFLLTPAAPSCIEYTDDPHHLPFRKLREKDGQLVAYRSGEPLRQPKIKFNIAFCR
jgi:hypothetical protein